jgi:hypothetical protein
VIGTDGGQYISTLNKKNFDLKLELYHRRQRTAALEKQLEQISVLESENSELQDINEQLLEELEKRDRAVQEAVGIICDLEEKVEVLEDAMDFHKPPSIHPGVEAPHEVSSTLTEEESTPKTPIQQASRLDLSRVPSTRLIDVASPSKLKTPSRTPSFLTSDNGGSAGALRSLYLAGEGDGKLLFPTLTKRKSGLNKEVFLPGSPEPGDGLDSPRLSVLSEADFMSVYGDTTRLDLDIVTPSKGMPNIDESHEKDEMEESNERERKKTRAERLQKWMDDRASPSKPSAAPSPVPASAGRFLSIGDVLHNRESANQESSRSILPPESVQKKKQKENYTTPASPILGGPIFGGQESEGLGATALAINNSSTSSIVAERSLLDGTPAAIRSHEALRPTERPRSAGEDIIRSSRDAFRGYETDYDSEESELEGRSLLVESGDYDDSEHQINVGQLPMLGSLSPSAMKMLGNATPSKSQLRERGFGGDMMFNGEGIDDLATMRGRKPNTRPRHLGQKTQPDVIPSSPPVEAVARSPPGHTARGSHTGYDGVNSPPKELRQRSPHYPPRSMTPPVPDHSSRSPNNGDSKMPAPLSRFRVPRVSLTPSPPKRGLKSRIFGRSTTQNSPAEPVESANPQEQASGFARPLRPFGGLIRSHTSKQIHPPNSVYVRPGTAGSVEPRSRYDRQLRGQHSGSTRGESSGGEGVWTPGGNGRGDSFTSEDIEYDHGNGRMEKGPAPAIPYRRADSQPRIRGKSEVGQEMPPRGNRRQTLARTSSAQDHRRDAGRDRAVGV